MFRHARTALLVFICGSGAFAQGSAGFRENLLPLLKKNPIFARFILTSFEFYGETGYANRLGNEAAPHLGGARIGPYEFPACYVKDQQRVPVTLVVNTNIRWWYKDGSEAKGNVLHLDKAVRFEEKLDSIEIKAFPKGLTPDGMLVNNKLIKYSLDILN